MHVQRWGVPGGSMGGPWWSLEGPWGDPWGSLGVPRVSLGGRVPGVSLNPLVAHGTTLWDPRGALGGSSGATDLIDRHPVVTMLAFFGP